MNRTTVSLPEDMELRLKAEAKRRGTSASEVVRVALESELKTPDKPLSFIAIGESRVKDAARRVDEIMAETRVTKVMSTRDKA